MSNQPYTDDPSGAYEAEAAYGQSQPAHARPSRPNQRYAQQWGQPMQPGQPGTMPPPHYPPAGWQQPYPPIGQPPQQWPQQYGQPYHVPPVETGVNHIDIPELGEDDNKEEGASSDDKRERELPKQLTNSLPELSSAALVLAIIGLLASFFPSFSGLALAIAIVGLALGILTLVCALKSDTLKDKWVPIISVAGAALGIIVACIMLILMPADASNAEDVETLDGKALAQSYGAQAQSGTAGNGGVASSTASPASSASASSFASGADTTSSSSSSLTGVLEGVENWVVDGNFLDLSLGTTIEYAPDVAVCVNSVTPGLINYDGAAISCVSVTYSNAGTSQKSYYEYDWQAIDSDGTQVKPCYYSSTENELSSGKIEGGTTVTGNIYFQGSLTKVLFASSQMGGAQASWVVS